MDVLQVCVMCPTPSWPMMSARFPGLGGKAREKKKKLNINCDVLYLPRQQQLPVKAQVRGAVVRQAVLLEPGLRGEQNSERKHTILIMD